MKRGSVFLEQARIVSHRAFDCEQYILRVYAPRIAAAAVPGQFIHIRCGDEIPLRRPYSIMSAAQNGTVEILYKVTGRGSRLLSTGLPADELSCLGPIGNGFELHPQRPYLLLTGGGVGIPPIMFLAQNAQRQDSYRPLVIMGSELPFPFELTTSSLAVGGCEEVDKTICSLEQAAIPARLASKRGFAGCYDGYVDALARQWLNATEVAANRIEIFACGPPAMLMNMSRLAADFGLPCQLAVEEYMACAVGGCAGCTIPVVSRGRKAMRRVCVDGPVFAAREVFPDLFE